MDFSVLLADLRGMAEKYKGQTTDPQVASRAYGDMVTQILKKAQKMTDKYEDHITMLWVALNQLGTIYKDLSNGTARDQLTSFIFGMCARTVLNIQWSQLDEDDKVKKDFTSTVETVHENLKTMGYDKFQLILNLMESQWTHPTLTQIMASEDDDIEDGEEYIKNEDPEILKLRIEIMMKENCEEFALNLCEWSLRHPSLKDDLKIRENQIVISYKQAEYKKMQEVCSHIVCHDGIYIMSRLAKNTANQDLCIRLAQVFLIQDWINPDRNCCTQELLKLWIHHQYLADKDEERFLDSIWTVAKVCQTTEQIGVLIEGVRRECGDMFIQLYTELCKYALNIDKGNWEQEEAKGNKEEVENRKKLIAQTCVRMAYMLKEYDFKMSRICGLTAFSLIPTTDNLNLVNKLYWTIKHTSVTSGNSKINPATIYEVERLLGLMRPEILNPDFSWKQLIPVCKRYQLKMGYATSDLGAKLQQGNPVKRTFTKPNILSTVPPIKTAIATARPLPQGNQKQKKIESPKSLQQSHAEHLLAQNRNLSREKVAQLVREKFPKSDKNDLEEGPPLHVKELDKTINDLKKSIVLENQYSVDLSKKLSSLPVKNAEIVTSQNPPQTGRNQQAINHGNSASRKFPQQAFTTQNANKSSSYSTKQSSSSGVSGSKTPVQPVNKHQNQHQNSVHETMKLTDSRTSVPAKPNFSVLRPPGSANQECAKIAQQIAEMHEKQRREKEVLEKARLQGRIDGAKIALNSKNIPSSTQISDLLTLTMKDKSGSTLHKVNSEVVNAVNKGPGEKSDQIEAKSNLIGHFDNVSTGLTAPTSESKKILPLNAQKCYLGSEEVMNSLKVDSSGNINFRESNVSVKPMSLVVPKALTSPDNQEQLMKRVTNMVKQSKMLPSTGALHAVIGNKVVGSSESKDNTHRKPHLQTGSSGYSRNTYNTTTSVITSNVQNDSNVRPVTTASITNPVYHHPPAQTQHTSTQPILPATVSSIGALQLNPNLCQTGEFVMTVVSDVGIQNMTNSGTVMAQPHLNHQVLNLQQSGSNILPQYQQYIPAPVQTAQVESHYVPQQTFATSPQYVTQQTNYSTTAYQTQQQVVASQPVMSSQSPIFQQQSVVPVVQGNVQDYSGMQNVPFQSYSMSSNTSQPVFQIQSPSVTKIAPKVNYNFPNQNREAISNSLPRSPLVQQSQPLHSNTGSSAMQQSAVKSGHRKPPLKQFMAPPELSPAVVQQILSSFKQNSSNNTRNSNQNGDGKTGNNDQIAQNEVEEKNLTKEVIRHLTMNKTDENVKRSVLEATQKILELRKQYGQGHVTSVSAVSTGVTSSMPSIVSGPPSGTTSMSVPELPDLGSKEFEIDSILRLEEDVKSQNESVVEAAEQRSASVEQSVIKVQSDKELLKQIETLLDWDGQPTSNQLKEDAYKTDEKQSLKPIQKQPQSTYLNANRIAKERQKTQNSNIMKPHMQSSKVVCTYCEHLFRDREQLQQHLDRNLCKKYKPQTEQVHEQIVCSICKSRFRTLNELKDHIKRNCRSFSPSKEKQSVPLSDFEYSLEYKCTNCNWMNGNEKISKKHVENCSSNVTNSPSKTAASLHLVYKCKLCSDIFSDKDTTYKHVSKLCPQLKALVGQRKAQETIDQLKMKNKAHLLKLHENSVESHGSSKVELADVNTIKKENVCSKSVLPETKVWNKMVNEESRQNVSKGDGIIVNGDVPKGTTETEPLKSDLVLDTETRINSLEEKYKSQIASVKSGTASGTNTHKEEDVDVSMHEIKRLKEKCYLEQFNEIERRKKALKEKNRLANKEERKQRQRDNNEISSQESEAEIKDNKTDTFTSFPDKRKERQSFPDKRKEGEKSKETDLYKKRKREEEPINRSHENVHSDYNIRKRPRHGTFDVRKEKGLRAKRLIKQKRYLIDEMEPIVPDGKKLLEKKTEDSDKKHIKKMPQVNKLDLERECRICSFQQRNQLLAKHYVQRHNIGFQIRGGMYKCNFCAFNLPEESEDANDNLDKAKLHIFTNHWKNIMNRIIGKQIKFPSPLKKKVSPVKSLPSRRSPVSPGKSEKVNKHLKALAMRKKCLENLQRIARRKLNNSDEESHSSLSEGINRTTTHDKKDKEKKQNEKRLSDSYALRRRMHDNERPRASETLVIGNSSQRLRSRSSSQSSRSSLNDHLSAGSNTGSTGSAVAKILLTRSGRRIKRPETDSSYVTESSNVEDDVEMTDEEEDVRTQQKRKLPQRHGRCSDKGNSTGDHYSSDDSSDEDRITRSTRSSDPQSVGHRKSLRDKSRKTQKTTNEMRSEKGDRKGKGSRMMTLSDDEYLSSATDNTESCCRNKVIERPHFMKSRIETESDTEFDGSKETSDKDSEIDCTEAERSYSLRKRKNMTVYRDYESSDIDNEGEPSDSKVAHSTARRKSPRRSTNKLDRKERDGNSEKDYTCLSEQKSVSVLVGPEDDEFLGLNEPPNTVQEVICVKDLENLDETEEDKQNKPVIENNVTALESDEEFASLKCLDPSSELNLKEVPKMANPKMVAFNSEFHKFTAQLNGSSDDELSETYEDGDEKPVIANQHENPVAEEIDDVPILPPKTDFVSAFHKFAHTENNSNVKQSKIYQSVERTNQKGPNFLSVFEDFFGKEHLSKQKPNVKPKEDEDWRREKGIVDCYVKVYRLTESSIQKYTNIPKYKGVKNTAVAKPLENLIIIDSESSSESEREFNQKNVKTNTTINDTAKVGETKEIPGKAKSVRHVSQNETLIQDIVVPSCIMSEMLLQDSNSQQPGNDYNGTEVDSEKSDENVNVIELTNGNEAENDPDYVWVENAETVAESKNNDCDVKEQEIVILTDTVQEEVLHNSNFVELHISDTCETGVENVITFIEDAESGSNNEGVGSNVVLIEVQDDQELIITNDTGNIEESLEQKSVEESEQNELIDRKCLNEPDHHVIEDLVEEQPTDSPTVRCGGPEVEDKVEECIELDHKSTDDNEFQVVLKIADSEIMKENETLDVSVTESNEIVGPCELAPEGNIKQIDQMIFEENESNCITKETDSAINKNIRQDDCLTEPFSNNDAGVSLLVENIADGEEHIQQSNPETVKETVAKLFDSGGSCEHKLKENFGEGKERNQQTTKDVCENWLKAVLKETNSEIVQENVKGTDSVVESIDNVGTCEFKLEDNKEECELNTPITSSNDETKCVAKGIDSEIIQGNVKGNDCLIEPIDKVDTCENKVEENFAECNQNTTLTINDYEPEDVTKEPDSEMKQKHVKENGCVRDTLTTGSSCKSASEESIECRQYDQESIKDGFLGPENVFTGTSSESTLEQQDMRMTELIDNVDPGEIFVDETVAERKESDQKLPEVQDHKPENILKGPDSEISENVGQDDFVSKLLSNEGFYESGSEEKTIECTQLELQDKEKCIVKRPETILKEDTNSEINSEIIEENVELDDCLTESSNNCHSGELNLEEIDAKDKDNQLDLNGSDSKTIEQHKCTTEYNDKVSPCKATLFKEAEESEQLNQERTEESNICESEVALIKSKDIKENVKLDDSVTEPFKNVGSLEINFEKNAAEYVELNQQSTEVSNVTKPEDFKIADTENIKETVELDVGSCKHELEGNTECTEIYHKRTGESCVDESGGFHKGTDIETCPSNIPVSNECMEETFNEPSNEQKELSQVSNPFNWCSNRETKFPEDSKINLPEKASLQSKNKHLMETSNLGNRYVDQEQKHVRLLTEFKTLQDSSCTILIDDKGLKVQESSGEEKQQISDNLTISVDPVNISRDVIDMFSPDYSCDSQVVDEYRKTENHGKDGDCVSVIKQVIEHETQQDQGIDDKSGELRVMIPFSSQNYENDTKANLNEENKLLGDKTEANSETSQSSTFEVMSFKSSANLTVVEEYKKMRNKNNVNICEDDRSSVGSDISLISMFQPDDTEDVEDETQISQTPDSKNCTMEEESDMQEVDTYLDANKIETQNSCDDKNRTNMNERLDTCKFGKKFKQKIKDTNKTELICAKSDIDHESISHAEENVCNADTSIYKCPVDVGSICKSSRGKKTCDSDQIMRKECDVLEAKRPQKIDEGNDILDDIDKSFIISNLKGKETSQQIDDESEANKTVTVNCKRKQNQREITTNEKKYALPIVSSSVKKSNLRKENDILCKKMRTSKIKTNEVVVAVKSEEVDAMQKDSCDPKHTSLPSDITLNTDGEHQHFDKQTADGQKTGRTKGKEIRSRTAQNCLEKVTRIRGDETKNQILLTDNAFKTAVKKSHQITDKEETKYCVKDVKCPGIEVKQATVSIEKMDEKYLKLSATVETSKVKEEIEDVEELFQRRMESVKRARKKSATLPYESDFNFDHSDVYTETDIIKQENIQPNTTIAEREFSIITRSNNIPSSEDTESMNCQQSVKPRHYKDCYQDFTEEIKTKMRTKSKMSTPVIPPLLPSPVKKLVTSERARTYIHEPKIEMFSPHIFACDSVKKITRQASYEKKNSMNHVSSLLNPTIRMSKLGKTTEKLTKCSNEVKKAHQIITESRSQRKVPAKKDAHHFTGLKSPQKRQEQKSDPVKALSPSKEPLFESKRTVINTTADRMVCGRDQKSTRKRPQNSEKEACTETKKANKSMSPVMQKGKKCPCKGKVSKSKCSVQDDSGIEIDKGDFKNVIKSELVEKSSKNIQSRKTKSDSKDKMKVVSRNLGKRARKKAAGDELVENVSACKTFKPDGTTRTPEKPDGPKDMCMHEQADNKCDKCSNNRRSRTTSPKPLYDNKRKTVRQIIHAGKVFEITKGSVTEREIQLASDKETCIDTQLSTGTGRVNTRGSKVNKFVCSGDDPDEKELPGLTAKNRSSKLNEYIHKTLKQIKQERETSPQWTMKKERNVKSQKFPYAFKRSRRN